MNLRRVGAAGERTAELYLIERGAKLLARNFRAAGGEVDLIMKMDGAVAFVEVKQRATDRYGTGVEAVDARKQQRICRAALVYMKQNKLMDAKVRFDVVEIMDVDIRHIPGAFPFAPYERH